MDKIKPTRASTEYYLENQEVMTGDAEVGWQRIPLEEYEVDALQHAMNIAIDEGLDVFWAECQNKPMKETAVAALEITKEVADRVSGFGQYVVPESAPNVVFGVDVHGELLYYTVAAIQNDFTGYVIDYGTWPEQPNPYFNLRTAKNTLSKHYGEEDTERAIELGVEDLVHRLLNHQWQTQNGDHVGVACGLVDVGYKDEEVRNALRRLLPASKVVLCALGRASSARRKPFTESDTSPKVCVRAGPDPKRPRWVMPTKFRDGEIYRVHSDTNYWKDTTATRLIQKAKRGRWELFGSERSTANSFDHGHYVSHLLAEKPTLSAADGRAVNVWEVVGSKDNHWFDTLVQCVLAGSLCGCQLPVEKPKQPPPQEQPPRQQQDDASFDLGDGSGRSFFASAR